MKHRSARPGYRFVRARSGGCDACEMWAEAYREALRFGSEPPAEFGMARAQAPLPVETSDAKRKARTMMRRIANTAIANELHQEMRERAAADQVETIKAEAYL